MNDIQRALGLGEFYHIGIAVREIDQGIGRLTAFGLTVGPVFDVLVPSQYRGANTEAGIRLAFAAAGPIALELVEPIAGESSVATSLRERGEGVQHFGYRVDDLEGTVAHAKELGIEAEWVVHDEHGLAVVFLAADAFFGVNLELVRKAPSVSLDFRQKSE